MLHQTDLIQEAANNHTDWFTASALVAGGAVRTENGLTCIESPASAPAVSGELILAFPRMDSHSGATLDAALSIARQNQVRQVSCWATLPTQPSDLGAQLLARGFQWGWQPHWMALDLHLLPPADFPVPAGLEIFLDEGSVWDVDDLPHYDPTEAARLKALIRRTPQQTFHFGARLNGKIVGHSLLHLSTGSGGIAGLYNVGVVPVARNQGIGRAISRAACAHAQTLGCEFVLLNAATTIYERLGFVSLGYGQTWWMFRPALAAPALTPSLVALTEAVGRGDISALEALRLDELPRDLDASLRCKLTLLEVAAQLQQPEAAQWLLSAGATPDIIPLCDLGWRDQLPGLLDRRPELANRCLGELGQTPLHEAIARNDLALLRLLLSAKPNLEIQDTQYHATALGWARHFGRAEMVSLLEAAP